MGQAASNFQIGQLYSEHGRWLSGWLVRRTVCRERAADLAHDTFCRLLEREALPSLDDPRGYLVTVARRLLIDDVRRREIERAYLAALVAEDLEDLRTPERVLEAVQLLDSLVSLLNHLPISTREAFLLRRLEGLSHIEIGERLGVSLRTVKRRVADAYQRCYLLAYPDT